MRKGRSSVSREVSEEIHINLMPLIDVVFVVLIMFIVIAPMLELDRVELASGVHREEGKVAVCREESPLAIHVHADDSLWMGGRRLSEKDLLLILKKARRETPQLIPQVFHDKNAHFGTYQLVKNAVEEAGFEQMDIILKPG